MRGAITRWWQKRDAAIRLWDDYFIRYFIFTIENLISYDGIFISLIKTIYDLYNI